MNRGMNNVWTLIAASAIVYAGFCIAMGVVPGVAMSHLQPLPGVHALSAQEQRGRAIYVSEGCSYCHTQNIRPLAQDKVFGRPSVGGDYVYDTPQLLGTERTGPDLSNIGLRQPSDVWQYIHLWDPRAVVHDSIMPRYPWLFILKKHADPSDVSVPVPPGYAPQGQTVIATQQARDLVAYLKALKQAPLPKASSP